MRYPGAFSLSLSLCNVAKVNGRFLETLGAGGVTLEGTPMDGGTVAVTVVNSVISLVTTACRASMLRMVSTRSKLSMYW